MTRIFVAQIAHWQKHSGKGSEEAAMLGSESQLVDARLLIAFVSSHAHEPAHRRGKAAHNVVVESRSQIRVVIFWINLQQFLGGGICVLGISQRSHVALLNEGSIV